MKLLADESVECEIVNTLREEGHDVEYVAEASPSISDDEVLDRANASGALLVTNDKDFGELVYRLQRVHEGVILIRLAGLSAIGKAVLVAQVLHDHAEELSNSFCVIAPNSVRIRH